LLGSVIDSAARRSSAAGAWNVPANQIAAVTTFVAGSAHKK
jgi:hypothetical protein